MANYVTTYQYAVDEQSLQRLVIATAKIASDIFTENPATASHAERMALVNYAAPRLTDLRSFAQEVAPVLFTLNAALAPNSADQDFYNALSSVWTAYAKILVAKGVISVTA